MKNVFVGVYEFKHAESAWFVSSLHEVLMFFSDAASFRPVLRTAWPSATLNAISSDARAQEAGSSADTVLPSVQIQHAVAFPDRVLLILKDGSSLPATERFECLYSPANSSGCADHPLGRLLARWTQPRPLPCRAIWCGCLSVPVPVTPGGARYNGTGLCILHLLTAGTTPPLCSPRMNLRPGRLGVASRMTTNPNRNGDSDDKPMLVSIRTKGQRDSTLPSIAEPEPLPRYNRHRRQKAHSMCVCTMLRNQARFLREWIIYHSHIGVERWFIYDNNSDDDIEQVLGTMDQSRYNVTRHLWPWMKSQEAGFAHCALRARENCEWVGFIDIDEFLHFPGNQTLPNILQNYSNRPRIGELRDGMPQLWSLRLHLQACCTGAPQVNCQADTLNPSLINVVHHFHLKEGVRYVNIGQGTMLINHYKYQVWEVFKDKFSGRVATYVADWKDEENVGSRDRAPGLGTKPVEPEDWPRRFCEVFDTGLKDFVHKAFTDPATGSLPW
ncbi:unnamed protein product [Miscanthus lutarioriparius]|uniref:Glycosyltransferase family 92 protein n=1 Tax=Miscanthus lutarioriparius TaxID=422564 RepID=A0A811PRJ7_9POAL|nr:unnamed protein product [Miscanthus lutarioriparius]